MHKPQLKAVSFAVILNLFSKMTRRKSKLTLYKRKSSRKTCFSSPIVKQPRLTLESTVWSPMQTILASPWAASKFHGHCYWTWTFDRDSIEISWTLLSNMDIFHGELSLASTYHENWYSNTEIVHEHKCQPVHFSIENNNGMVLSWNLEYIDGNCP